MNVGPRLCRDTLKQYMHCECRTYVVKTNPQRFWIITCMANLLSICCGKKFKMAIIQNFAVWFEKKGVGWGGGSLSPPRLNIFTVGNMGVMICLGQGGLRSLSASTWRCDKGTIGHKPLNSNLHVGLHLFVWITYIYVVSWKKNSYFMQSVLVLFCLKKMPWSYNSFSGKQKKKFPYCLQSAYVKKIEILTLKYCPRTNPPTSNHHQHTNFVKGTLSCYLVFLKCAHTSSDSWIRHWQPRQYLLPWPWPWLSPWPQLLQQCTATITITIFIFYHNANLYWTNVSHTNL